MIDYTKPENNPNWTKIEKISIHDDNNIIGLFKTYRWLSNFHICDIEYEGLKFTSTEAAYHSAKYLDPEIKKLFVPLGPMESLRTSRKYPIEVKNWHDIKYTYMYDVNWKKYQIPELKKMLLDTGNKHIAESNWWKDLFWGQDEHGNGENNLGLILMCIREHLQFDELLKQGITNEQD